MSKRRDTAKTEELERIRTLCLLILDFLSEIGLPARDAKSMSEIVLEAYASRDLAALRMLQDDLTARIRELPLNRRAEIQQLLTQASGIDLGQEERDRLAEIGRIMDRGRITTEDEYRLVLERVEEIYEESPRRTKWRASMSCFIDIR